MELEKEERLDKMERVQIQNDVDMEFYYQAAKDENLNYLRRNSLNLYVRREFQGNPWHQVKKALKHFLGGSSNIEDYLGV